MLEQKLDKISQENQNQVVNIKISDVYPNGDQPRIYFDEDKIIALCESIKKHGVLQPIVVRPDDEGRYMIIAGERRYRASIMANKESIPAIIKDMPIKEVLEINSLLSSRLKKLLKESKPDLIIGTHPFPMIALSTLKKKYPYRNAFNSFFVPPLISVLTDYTAHSAYIQDEIDYYIAGDEYVREVLISEGIEDDKIKPYGIPVEKSFLEHRDKNVVLEELGLEPDKFTVLLMGGSFGAGNIKDTLKELILFYKLYLDV